MTSKFTSRQPWPYDRNTNEQPLSVIRAEVFYIVLPSDTLCYGPMYVISSRSLVSILLPSYLHDTGDSAIRVRNPLLSLTAKVRPLKPAFMLQQSLEKRVSSHRMASPRLACGAVMHARMPYKHVTLNALKMTAHPYERFQW